MFQFIHTDFTRESILPPCHYRSYNIKPMDKYLPSDYRPKVITIYVDSMFTKIVEQKKYNIFKIFSEIGEMWTVSQKKCSRAIQKILSESSGRLDKAS